MRDNRNFNNKNNKKTNNFKGRNFDKNRNYGKNRVKSFEKKAERVENNEDTFQDQIEGRNSVLELLESDKDINKIFVEKGEKHGSINKILGMARDKRIVVVEVDRQKINQMAQTENHQGVIAIVPPYNYCEVDDILNEAITIFLSLAMPNILFIEPCFSPFSTNILLMSLSLSSNSKTELRPSIWS